MPKGRLEGPRAVARVLDDLVRIPGTRVSFGLDPLIGLLPVAGDLAGALFSAYILVVGARMGAPASVLMRMGGNIAIDTVVGAVPVLGDLFDFGWKANRRNLALLERYEATPAAVRRGSRALVATVLLVLLVLLAGAVAGGWLLLRAVARAL